MSLILYLLKIKSVQFRYVVTVNKYNA